MKTVAQIRRENLELLRKEFGTLEALAVRAETSSVYLSQVRNQTIDLKTDKPRQMGGSMARRLDRACNKPNGWMDTDHAGEAADPNAVDTPVIASVDQRVRVPVVGSARIDREEFVVDTSQGGGYVVGLSGDEPDNLYAVRIVGDAPFGFLREGQFLVFERSGDPFLNLYFLATIDNKPQLAELLNKREDRVSVEAMVSKKRVVFDVSELTGGVDCVMWVVSAGKFEAPSATPA